MVLLTSLLVILFSTTNSMALRHLVFVYGTLKKGEPNSYLISNFENGGAKLIGKAVTDKKWPLVIASRFNIPYLLHVEDKGLPVYGEVYDVDDKALSCLDELECHPNYYTRIQESVTVLEDNSKLNPWIYFLRNYKPELLSLPFIEDYSSSGNHNQPYVERYKRPDGEHYYADVQIFDK